MNIRISQDNQLFFLGNIYFPPETSTGFQCTLIQNNVKEKPKLIYMMCAAAAATDGAGMRKSFPGLEGEKCGPMIHE